MPTELCAPTFTPRNESTVTSVNSSAAIPFMDCKLKWNSRREFTRGTKPSLTTNARVHHTIPYNKFILSPKFTKLSNINKSKYGNTHSQRIRHHHIHPQGESLVRIWGTTTGLATEITMYHNVFSPHPPAPGEKRGMTTTNPA